MADTFDPTLKKKKKKTKKVLAELEDEIAVPEDLQTSQEHVAEDAKPQEETSGELDFSSLKKKKKKKTKETDAEADVEANVAEATNELGDMSLKKKKKKRASKPAPELEGNSGDQENNVSNEGDYDYQELLDRVFAMMRSKNPEMISGEKKRFKMKPPHVVRLGTKKTGFVNFTEIADLLRRPKDHLLSFIFAELGTSGSVDGNNCLVIKGRFQQKQIESVLRNYIREYVTCHTCKSPDTLLVKENRLYFLQCQTCHSRCSVASIKYGFQALTGKRSKLRAKAATS